jgi:CheY-like chemotaxis protein
MSNKILLVDDEELFLKSLKDGLDLFSEVFETDICFSVNEAIKLITANQYDLVITDIRIAEKGGTDLLIFLRDIHYSGKVMVMTAYATEESQKMIKSYGVVDVISKPFKLEWFTNMLLEYFKEEKKSMVTFESIELVTVMQIINLEKKTLAVEIKTGGKIGVIYFVKGEIIHAEYNGIEGYEAVLKLITLTQGTISVKKNNNKVKHSIEIPFVHLMMDIMKTHDEFQLSQEKKEKKKSKKGKNKDVSGAVGLILNTLKEIKGYLGAGVFTPQGKKLGGSIEISGIRFDEVGSLIHKTLSNSEAMAKKVGFGKLDMIQLYSEIGIVFAKCSNQGNLHFHTILVVKADSNVVQAKLKLEKMVETLKQVL